MVNGDPPKAERELVADLRLHPQRPPVTRLSRKVLIGLAGVAIIAVLGAVMWALDPPEHVDVGEVLILPTAQGAIPPASQPKP